MAPFVCQSPHVSTSAREGRWRSDPPRPLFGGARGEGWDLGRDVYLSDVAAALHRVEGGDDVEELALLRERCAGR